MKKHYQILMVILAGAAITLSFYHKVIFHPGDYLFSDHGDGMKNYFTYAWHISHDTSCANFQGMNYPYGEHMLYSDCHPALSESLRHLSLYSDFFSENIIGILNFFMIFSLFLTIVTCYFLLREFGVSYWLSLSLSIGMALLAPQIFRLSGHFALSYSFAIPLSWILLLKALKSERVAVSVIFLFLNGLFWMFIHAYLGVMVTAFLMLTLVVLALRDYLNRKLLMQFALISAVILPVLIFYICLQSSDSHIGRTTNPSGFFLYNAEPDDLFLPHKGLLRNFLDQFTGNGIDQEWEARGYIGLAATVIILLALFASILRWFRPKKAYPASIFFAGRTFQASLVAALILLIFAMGIPFKQWPALLDYFPVLKQFRATGRFVWPFYFAALTFSAIVLQNLLTYNKSGKWRVISMALAILVASLTILEGLPYHTEISRSITRSPNLFRKDLLPEDHARALQDVRPGEYQAIISLPFYYYGSESYSRPRRDEAKRNSMVFAFHTGLPLVNADLTRTSVTESKKIVQLLSPDFYTRDILKDLPGQRPFLVVKSGTDLTAHEQSLIKKSTRISQNGAIELYSLSTEALFRNSGPEIINRFVNERTSLYKMGEFYLTDSTAFVFLEDYNDRRSEILFDGTGAFASEKKGRNTIAEFNPGTFERNTDYNISIWMYNGEPDALNFWFRLIVEEYDEEANEWISTIYFPEEAETIDGSWSLVEGTFRISDPLNKVSIITKGSPDSRASLHADDLLIKESGVDVFRYDENHKILFYNNHRVKNQPPGDPAL